MHILIIEDDDYWCTLWYAALTLYGWTVEMASSAGEAFFLLDNNQFDLIVCDIRLPDGDGFQIKLDLERRGIRTPTIFLTSYIPQDAAILARRLNAAALITKPVSSEELIKLIEKVMQKGG